VGVEPGEQAASEDGKRGQHGEVDSIRVRRVGEIPTHPRGPMKREIKGISRGVTKCVAPVGRLDIIGTGEPDMIALDTEVGDRTRTPGPVLRRMRARGKARESATEELP
jgi:hypothetical protein